MSEHHPKITHIRESKRDEPWKKRNALLKKIYTDVYQLSSREMRIFLAVYCNMPYSAKEQAYLPFRATDVAVGGLAVIDSSNARKAIGKLIEQRILNRQGEFISVNYNVDEWRSHAEFKGAQDASMTTRGYKRKKQPAIASQETSISTAESTAESTVDSTYVNGPGSSIVAGLQIPLKSSINTTHDQTLEKEEKDLSLLGREVSYDRSEPMPATPVAVTGNEMPFNPRKSTEMDISIHRRNMIREAATLLREGGYHIPPKRGALGETDPMIAFEGLLEQSIEKHIQIKGGGVSELDYLRDFIVPAIADCPKQYRSSYRGWKDEFTFKLAECRALGHYINGWEEATKAKKDKGSAPIGDFGPPADITESVDWTYLLD